MERLFALLIGYAFGCFQTAYIVGKFNGIDIREHGSGNAGTTNSYRVMGSKAAAIVFVGDFLKMVLSILLVRLLFETADGGNRLMLTLYTALGVILGHDFPFYMSFKGGKGIASTAGLILMLDWRLVIIGLIVFFGLIFLTHLVSLASCTLIFFLLICSVILITGGHIPTGSMAVWEAIGVIAFICVLALFQHRSNIGRLLRGEEKKVILKMPNPLKQTREEGEATDEETEKNE